MVAATVRSRAGDEAAREHRRAPRALTDDGRGQLLAAREPQQPAQPSRQLRERVPEVLLRQPFRLLPAAVVVQGGKHVHITQQAAAKAVIGDGVGEEPVLDALGGARPVARRLRQQRASELLRALLDVRAGGGCGHP
jgi:hypothetical protein